MQIAGRALPTHQGFARVGHPVALAVLRQAYWLDFNVPEKRPTQS